MATVYKFVIAMPVLSTLARDRLTNNVHLQHVTGGLGDPDLQTMCQDIVAMYQKRYGSTTKEISCTAYDVGPKPNYPRAVANVNAGQVWTTTFPPELALVLSWAAHNRGNKSERGRIYLNPNLSVTGPGASVRPTTAQLTWAMAFYTTPNESFPDLGGVDWKFGTYSPTYQKFTQSTQAWCNDDWDIQRRRGLRETTRQSVTRDG